MTAIKSRSEDRSLQVSQANRLYRSIKIYLNIKGPSLDIQPGNDLPKLLLHYCSMIQQQKFRRLFRYPVGAIFREHFLSLLRFYYMNL